MDNQTVNFQTLTMTRTGKGFNPRPRIQLLGQWLPETGFITGALAQTVPEDGGFMIKLCDENIDSYSELYLSTKARSGALNRVFISNSRTNKGPTLVITGRSLARTGLEIGDRLVAKCEYGIIRVRKLPENLRLVRVSKVKHEKTGEHVAKVWLFGDWLPPLDFTIDTLVTATPEPGCITVKAWDTAVVYSEVVKFARQNKARLIQVSAKDGVPLIHFGGSVVDRAGFALDDVIAAECLQGAIKLQKLDPVVLGF